MLRCDVNLGHLFRTAKLIIALQLEGSLAKQTACKLFVYKCLKSSWHICLWRCDHWLGQMLRVATSQSLTVHIAGEHHLSERVQQHGAAHHLQRGQGRVRQLPHHQPQAKNHRSLWSTQKFYVLHHHIQVSTKFSRYTDQVLKFLKIDIFDPDVPLCFTS